MLQLLQATPADALPTWCWQRVQSRLQEPASRYERFNLWVWWNRRWLATMRWAVVGALALLAIGTWAPPTLFHPENGADIAEYAQVVSYAQSSLVDDPLTENTQIILSGWRE